MVAGASAAVAGVPLPGLSITFDVAVILREINLYKSQLGIPNENSTEFQGMTSEMKAKILKYCVTTALEVSHLLTPYAASSAAEEFVRFIPIVGSVIAGSISFCATYWFLDRCLTEIEEAAFDFLHKTMGRVADESHLN